MDLPSTYHYQGWDIRYRLASSKDPATTTPSGNPKQPRPVVFVHGTPWSSAVFRPLIEALLTKGPYRILVYDLPGYGQSQNFDSRSSEAVSKNGFAGDTSVAFQAQALTALLKETQLDGKDGHPAPAVLAHDIAGTVVLRAHLLHDCEFDTMLLVDTNAVLPWGDGFYKLARSNPQTFVDLPAKVFEAVVRAVTRSACHNPKVLQTGWEDVIAGPWIGSPSESPEAGNKRQRSFVRQIAQANDADVAEMLEGGMYARVRCDVKIVSGAEDQWIPREKIEGLIMQLGSRMKESAFIPNAGHLVMLDQPERFAVEVFDWLMRYGEHRAIST
ncbi:hypothetical protein B0A55_12306 [Friedmanniomyces simplex]|uniref:AB hydrolase-1 domain-containing protein n=1 Tax=Friedmanniomyces simplex TaxID=329884 RepID=A0A4U0WHZ1_9PEZI|nr:hypothetical protein B0A55_12306 [Friedmanniomyces simplex]